MKLLADLKWGPRRRREKSGVLELLGLLDNPDQGRRFAGDAGDFQLTVGHMQFSQIRVVRQGLRQRLEHNDGRSHFPFLLQ